MITRRNLLKRGAPAVGVAVAGLVPPPCDPDRQGSVRVDGEDLVTEWPDGRVWRHPISGLKSIRVGRFNGQWTIITEHETPARNGEMLDDMFLR